MRGSLLLLASIVLAGGCRTLLGIEDVEVAPDASDGAGTTGPGGGGSGSVGASRGYDGKMDLTGAGGGGAGGGAGVIRVLGQSLVPLGAFSPPT